MLEEFKSKIKALLNEYELEGMSSTKFKSKYEILYSMSESILLISAESDLINLISSIMKNREYLIYSYNNKLKEYKERQKNNASNKELNSIAIILNEMANELDIYKRIIEIYNGIIKSKKESIKSNELDNSDQIIDLLKKYNNEKDKSKKEELNMKIFDLVLEREKKVKDKYGIDGVKILFEIESLEKVIAINDNIEKDYTLDANGYEKKIWDLIYSINEYNFRDKKNHYFINKTYYEYNKDLTEEENEEMFYNKYISNINSFNNLIESLFNTKSLNLIVNNDYNVTSKDVLNYLTNYNIQGGYSLFKSKFENARVGNEIVSKKIYYENVELINHAIISLCANAKILLGDKKVTITSHQKTDSELLKELKSKYKELSSLSVGEYNVHR